MIAFARGQEGFSGPQIWQGGAAALADQIQHESIRPNSKPLTNKTGEARTQISGAGADQDGIQLVSGEARVGEGFFRGFGGKTRRMIEKTSVQRVGRNIKGFGEIVE